MPPTRILIDVPNTQRDLLALAYLKVLLENEGFVVRLSEGAKTTLLTLLSFKPDVVVLGQVMEIHGSTLAKHAKSLGAKVVVLRTEGILRVPEKEEDAKVALNSDIATLTSTKFIGSYDAYTDLDLVWGPEFRAVLVRWSDLGKDKVKVVGNPRYDFYHEPLFGYFDGKQQFCRKYGLDPARKIVSYTSNLVFADLDLTTVSGNLNYLDTYEFLRREREKHARQRDVTTGHFLRLAEEMPGVTFLLKLHPWEDTQYYADVLAKRRLPNVLLARKDELIGNVLSAADVMLHINSTTATEAWLLDRPVVTMSFLPEYEGDFSGFTSGCRTAKTYPELKEAVARYLHDPSIEPGLAKEREKFIAAWYFSDDGDSTRRAAKEIAELANSPTRPKRPPRVRRTSLKLAAKVDAPALLRYLVYDNSLLRNAYLKFRWKRSKKARDLLGQAYRTPFKQQAVCAEEKIRKLLGA